MHSRGGTKGPAHTKMRELMNEPWIEKMTINGQGKVYEHITEHMWTIEGEIYGLQPGDHRHGQETTAALKQKRQRRAEVMKYVSEVAQHAQEVEMKGVLGTWQRWAKMQRAEIELSRVHRKEGKQWRHRIQDELREACRANKAADTWRLSRLLAGQQMGAKRRRLNAPEAEVPTAKAWAQHLRKQGPDGGCEGN